MTDKETELNKAYFMWLAELRKLQGPRVEENDHELTLDSLINYLRGTIQK